MDMLEIRRQELHELYPSMTVDEIEDQADDDIVLNYRDSYMVDGLLRLDKPSILGIVGRDHLEGMKRDWEEKTGIPQNSFLNLF
ncbi:hypothetical protein L195_g049974 [Trifolium pratense]|uniref:Uncharacterized protein n=1 Tax=Trifolium pratense TaxID=57577 RepID=A0A2K3JRG9_TRIPR|nr:hypothetical protein L195_g049974 [Trifolium pratense]